MFLVSPNHIPLRKLWFDRYDYRVLGSGMLISGSCVCRILHGNYLIGAIPRELYMLKSLKVLDFGMNQLTGPIPSEIGNITQLVNM